MRFAIFFQDLRDVHLKRNLHSNSADRCGLGSHRRDTPVSLFPGYGLGRRWEIFADRCIGTTVRNDQVNVLADGHHPGSHRFDSDFMQSF